MCAASAARLSRRFSIHDRVSFFLSSRKMMMVKKIIDVQPNTTIRMSLTSSSYWFVLLLVGGGTCESELKEQSALFVTKIRIRAIIFFRKRRAMKNLGIRGFFTKNGGVT